jgi:hypothetical protein
MGAYAHVLVDIRFIEHGLLKLLVAAGFGSLLARAGILAVRQLNL